MQTIEEWRIVFFISSGIYLVGAIIYGLFCSGERQPWAIDETRPEQNGIKPNTQQTSYINSMDIIEVEKHL